MQSHVYGSYNFYGFKFYQNGFMFDNIEAVDINLDVAIKDKEVIKYTIPWRIIQSEET